MPADTAVPALRVSLFGQPRLEWEGQPLKVSAPPKTLPLLAYLILHAATPLTRDSIAFTLWEDESEENARANLRRHLYHLQRALPVREGAPWLLVGTDSLQWNVANGAWVDVLEFGRLSASAETLEQAVDLYAGDLLANYYDDWVFGERERLRNEYLNALYALTVDHRSRRLRPSAVRYAKAILAADPWREDAVRQLMSVQYESGDRAGALQSYADFQRKLRAEMAVDPMPETAALHDLIVRNAPVVELGSPTPDTTMRGPVLPSLPFVGRQAAMEQLRSLWSRAARGLAAVGFIEGEAGVGKSRLAAELALRVEAEGGRVLWGPTSSPESSPYQGLAEALRQALPLLGALKIRPDALAAVAALVPELRERRVDLPHPPRAEPEDERRRLLEGVGTVLEALGQSRPLLLIIEDVHWAGEATISALRYLGSKLQHAALLVLATYREEEVPRAHALRGVQRELLALGTAARVTPARLQAYDVERLIAQFPPLAQRTDLATVLHERSEGNCLFLAQMIGDLLENPQVLAEPLEAVGAAAGARVLPKGLHEVIESRLARLSDATRVLAEIAAVFGQGFNVELVAEVSGWSNDKVFDGFNELLDRRLIRELPKRGSFEYAFAHHLILDAIYAQIPPSALVARHRRAGHVLADSPDAARGELAAAIARHFDIGQERELAARFYVAAARHALSVYAGAEALAYLQSGLRLTSDERARADTLLMMETIHGRHGDREAQQGDLEQLEGLAARLRDEELQAEVLARRVARERALGNRDKEAQLIEEFSRHSRSLDNPKWVARAGLAQALHAMHTGRIEQARGDAEEALPALQRAGDRESEVECLCLLADVHTQIGNLDAAERAVQSAAAVAEAGSHPALVARAYLAISRAAIMQHQFARCEQSCTQARRLFGSVGDREGEADALARHASVLGRLQRYDEARQANETAAAIYEEIGKDEGKAGQLVNGAMLDARLGLLDEAEQKLVHAEAIFRKLSELRGLTVCALNLSFTYLVLGQLDEALAKANEALASARALQHKAFTAQALANLGAVERDLGRFDSALEHMQEGLALQEGLSRPADQVNDLADLSLAYLMKGDLAAAMRTADRMLAGAEESTDAAFWPQVAFWTGARVYRACGKPDRAAALLEQAREYAARVAGTLADPKVLDKYKSLPVNRQISAAHDRAQWPDAPMEARPA